MTIKNRAELVVRRNLVREFIKADSIDLVLMRVGEGTKTLAGGYIAGELETVSDDPQLARIVQNRRRYNNGIVNSEAGDIPHTDYLLLGMHTLDVEVNDEFVSGGVNYKVTGISEIRTESTLCSIDMLGADNHGA